MTIGIQNAIASQPHESTVGLNWGAITTAKLTELRIDNPNLSQREFARLAEGHFPGRTFNGVYHQVRRLDILLAAENAPVVATEIG